MNKLVFYRTNEHWSITPEDIVYIKADHNYTYIALIKDILEDKDTPSVLLPFQLGQTIHLIGAQSKEKKIKGDFFSIDRGLHINGLYIRCVNPGLRKLILSDNRTFCINLAEKMDLSYESLLKLKKQLEEQLSEDLKNEINGYIKKKTSQVKTQ